MIEILCNETTDRAEAETVLAAILAGRTLIDDARSANPVYSFNPTVTFLVEGRHIIGPLRSSEMGFAANALTRALRLRSDQAMQRALDARSAS